MSASELQEIPDPQDKIALNSSTPIEAILRDRSQRDASAYSPPVPPRNHRTSRRRCVSDCARTDESHLAATGSGGAVADLLTNNTP